MNNLVEKVYDTKSAPSCFFLTKSRTNRDARLGLLRPSFPSSWELSGVRRIAAISIRKSDILIPFRSCILIKQKLFNARYHLPGQ